MENTDMECIARGGGLNFLGPKPLLLKFLKDMDRGYEDQSVFYDFGYTFVNFKPTAYCEHE
jgi:hypothetical protein